MATAAQGEGDRIARLLEELQAMAGPTTWQRVEELVRRLVALYGDALGRVLEIAREGGALDAARTARLCEEEPVASLLLLHGLHPVPTAERVARAVEALRARLAPDVTLALEGLGEDGVLRLRVAGEAQGCGGAGAALARGIEHALLEAAPELARVEIAGVAGDPPERLVSLRAPRAVESATK
jgi:Fe-S cluster biogenesis protein NfuA